MPTGQFESNLFDRYGNPNQDISRAFRFYMENGNDRPLGQGIPGDSSIEYAVGVKDTFDTNINSFRGTLSALLSNAFYAGIRHMELQNRNGEVIK